MSDPSQLLHALAPILKHLSSIGPAQSSHRAELNEKFPLGSPILAPIEKLVREGVQEGWLCPRGEPGMRYGRLCKATPETHQFSVDAVDMSQPGPGHEHPNGEFDLCIPLEGQPTFDQQPAGWTVYPPKSWHVPTVQNGRMAILYFLPEGQIRFGPRSPS